jgi:hypothetical protein
MSKNSKIAKATYQKFDEILTTIGLRQYEKNFPGRSSKSTNF